jgi:hypothetical protein
MYSRFITLGRFLSEQKKSEQGTDAVRQAFINGWRAEPWSARADSVSVTGMASVSVHDADGYQHGSCPGPVWRAEMAVDQQGIVAEKSWFPYRVRAYTETGHSWLVEAGHVNGFDGLEQLAGKQFPMGQVVRGVDVISVDTANGNMIRPIRQWCALDPRRRISIGGSGTMLPETPWSETRITAKNAATLCGLPVVWYYNSHLFRDELYECLRAAPGRAPLLIPGNAPEFYLNSLHAEERINADAMLRGRLVRRNVWRKRQWTDQQGRIHERQDNHWWDVEVQGLAVVTILGWFAQFNPANTNRPNQ